MAKRRANNELNRDNWDEEEEPEEIGCFKIASDNVLKGRVIKQARRRIVNTNSAAETEPKSIFSGFTGFAKSVENNKLCLASGDGNTNGQKAAFSFLSKPNSASNCETKPKFSFLSNTTLDSKSSESATEKSPSFSFLKGDAVNSKETGDPSTIKPTIGTDVSEAATKSTLSFASTISFKKSNESSDIVNKDKLNELSKELMKTEKQGNETTVQSKDDQNKTPDDIFLQKLRSLNLLCAEWIIKHLNENLGYILTPIFDDYKKYLNQLKEERQRANSSTKKLKIDDDASSADVSSKAEVTKPLSSFKVPDFKTSLSKLNPSRGFFSPPTKQEEEKPLGFKFTKNAEETASNFSFPFITDKNKSILKPVDKNDGTDDTGIFKFGNSVIKPISNEGFGSLKPAASEGNVPNKESPKMQPFFSFTPSGTSLTSNPLIAQTASPTVDETNSKDDEDTPPVKEDVTIMEEGSIYDKKCKVFIKKDGNFVDHGVGFLFLKLVGEEQKCQVIVRANNKLANVIINVLLTSSVPIQLMGKNNVMLVCCPTPEAKPSSVLLKVKTAEDAHELLEIMNKHKK